MRSPARITAARYFGSPVVSLALIKPSYSGAIAQWRGPNETGFFNCQSATRRIVALIDSGSSGPASRLTATGAPDAGAFDAAQPAIVAATIIAVAAAPGVIVRSACQPQLALLASGTTRKVMLAGARERLPAATGVPLSSGRASFAPRAKSAPLSWTRVSSIFRAV